MTYKSVAVTRRGSPDVLKIIENDHRLLLEDWTTLFKLLEERKIKPIIAGKFSLLKAAKANELLESGQVVGNVVLLAPELLKNRVRPEAD